MNLPPRVMAFVVDHMAGNGHIARELRKLPLGDVIDLERRFSRGDYPAEWTREERSEAALAAECIVAADCYRRGM